MIIHARDEVNVSRKTVDSSAGKVQSFNVSKLSELKKETFKV
jgi:hypothetical protein